MFWEPLAFAKRSDPTDELIRQASTITREIAGVMKGLEADPSNADLKSRLGDLQGDLGRVNSMLGEEIRRATARLKSEFGIDEELLRHLEIGQRPRFGNEYWNSEIQRVPKTAGLEDAAADGLEYLLSFVDLEWLRGQARFPYRQRYDAADTSNCRLHLVGRQRLLPASAPAKPQRFAQMLLVCDDMLKGRHDLDLFDGPILVSEVAALGTSLSQVQRLGPEAGNKLKSLPTASDRDVASIIYELLVGTACLRCGRDVEMLPASTREKSPDFRIHDLVVPMVVECKRRLGLNEYAVKEARCVERQYSAAEDLFERYHPLVEVVFNVEVSTLPDEAMVDAIRPLVDSWADEVEVTTDWGTIRLRRLPITLQCSATRVFSPAFLLKVFDWDHVESQWDGLLCEIAPTMSPVATEVSSPRGLKWRCDADASHLKKARGLTSLWADAVRQIPAGEMGCVYIAYTEGMRGGLADARTRHLVDTVQKRELFHRASITVPLTVISRLYPQAFGDGGVELIESVIPMTQDGYDRLLEDFPSQIFNVLG